jgi:tetratricopeptide (TPR) repeat protein
VVVIVVSWLASSAHAQDVPDPEAETETADADIEVLTEAEAEAATSEEVESAEARAERLEEARLLFLAAQRAFDDGRYPDALASFERSYLLAEDPQILYNIGVTLDRLRRDDEALEAFQMYLRLRPSTPDRRSIEARIQILEDQIARRAAQSAAPVEPEEPPSLDVSTTGATQEEPRDDDEYTVLDRWWFWTAVVAIVAGGAIAIGIVASQDPSPAGGTDGVVLEALSW